MWILFFFPCGIHNVVLVCKYLMGKIKKTDTLTVSAHDYKKIIPNVLQMKRISKFSQFHLLSTNFTLVQAESVLPWCLLRTSSPSTDFRSEHYVPSYI